MAIKEIPTNIRIYYKLMTERSAKLLDAAIDLKEELVEDTIKVHKELESKVEFYKDKFGIDLNSFEEFKNNIYTTGHLYKIAKGLFINSNNDYELVSELFDLYDYAENLKKINGIDKEIEKYNKLLKLKVADYRNLLNIYYTEVHKKLVLEGQGYAFSNGIGWICINRVVLHRPKKMIDYAATKKREKELRDSGKRIYNKDEAEWCAKNGIEYNAEDKRVFRKDEYCYEIPLLGCKLPNGTKYKLDIANYMGREIRGMNYDQLIEYCNNDIKKICSLPLNVKIKLTLCDKIDKILYTKFIRNEAQKSITAPKTRSKNRQ